jgi:hypothetical protein
MPLGTLAASSVKLCSLQTLFFWRFPRRLTSKNVGEEKKKMLSLLALCFASLGTSALQQQIVVVGLSAGNSIGSSNTGLSWTGSSVRGPGGCATFNSGRSVAFSSQQSLWVATGATDGGFFSCPYAMAYSRDGVLWTGISNTPLVTSGKVAYSASQNKWLALGFASCGSAAVSSDGINWGSCMRPISSPKSVATGNGVWIVGGQSPEEIGVSTDLVTWTKVTGIMESVSAIAYSSVQNKFVAVGQGGTVAGGPAHFLSTLAYSTNNGQNWTTVPSTSFVADEGFGVAYSVARNQWIAVGSYTDFLTNAKQGIVATSTDAITWTTVAAHPFSTTSGSRCDAIVFSESLSLWILSGQIFPPAYGNALATSPDGLVWTLRTGAGNDFLSVSAIAVSNNASVAASPTTRPAVGGKDVVPALALLILACVVMV